MNKKYALQKVFLETLAGIILIYAKVILEMGWAKFIQNSASVHIMYFNVHCCKSLNNSDKGTWNVVTLHNTIILKTGFVEANMSFAFGFR